jgi:mxaA protein
MNGRLLVSLVVLALGSVASAQPEPPPNTASMPGMPNVAAPVPQGPPPNATVVQPRAFGFVIGDVLTQRVLLKLHGEDFEPAELPTPGRAGIWFERRAIRVEQDASKRRWLVIDYQLMNAPQTLAVARLPPWKLKSKQGSAELRIAEWPITVGPLTPREPLSRSGLTSLRPDHSPTPVEVAPIREARFLGGFGLLATVAAWLGWWIWRNVRAAQTRPFASALREMRNLDDASPEAWHTLHRAFDRTAGHALRAESLPALFERAPQLQPLRATIEEFFSQSAAWFFAGRKPDRPIAVHELCRDLHRIEKRYER